jgi:glycosyltransferase involved in cell wall biosynthesis
MVGGNGVSYGNPPPHGSWRDQFVAELGGRLDLDRVLFPGRIPYQTYVRMLQRSDAHVYLTYPFVASWSLRESLAAGCAVVGSDTPPVQEFIEHQHTGLLVPFFDPDRVADAILSVLEDKVLSKRLRTGARRWAEANLDMHDYLAAYLALIANAVGDAAEGLTLPEKRSEPFDDRRRGHTSRKATLKQAAASHETSLRQSRNRSA